MTTLSNIELLNYVLNITDLKTFNTAIKKHNLQLIYENKKNSLLYDLFDGQVLKFSTKMSEVFNEVQNTEQAFVSLGLEQKIAQLKFSISYDRKNSELIKQHNILVAEFKNINIGVNKMIKQFRKIYNDRTF